MRKLAIWMVAAGSLGVAGWGCSRTAERAEANYYQRRAEHASAKGNYHKAAREEDKAQRAREKEASAPLP